MSVGAGLLGVALGVLERGGGFLSLLGSDFPVLLFAEGVEGTMLPFESGRTGAELSVNCSSPPGPPYLGL
jgi:hypothetical protein